MAARGGVSTAAFKLNTQKTKPAIAAGGAKGGDKPKPAGGFTLFGGKPKSAAPAKAAAAPKPKAKGFTLAGSNKKKAPSTPPAKTQAKNVKSLQKSFGLPAAKPAATRASKPAKAPAPSAKPKTGGKRDLKKEVAKWYGKDRALYLPGGIYERDEVPAWLDGTLAGDYGFDPLELGKDKATVEKYREFELLHARWAMLAVPGVVFPEALGVKGGTWFETGKAALEGQLDYTAPPLFSAENPLPLPLVALIQIGLMGLAEKYRQEGKGPEKGWAPRFGAWQEGDGVWNGVSGINPGGPLNPFGAASGSKEELDLMKVREIKNGRLAMLTMLGVFVQAAVTGEGPYANWAKHVADPFGYNISTIFNPDYMSDFTTL